MAGKWAKTMKSVVMQIGGWSISKENIDLYPLALIYLCSHNAPTCQAKLYGKKRKNSILSPKLDLTLRLPSLNMRT